MSLKDRVARRIRDFRRAKQLSQEQLAERVERSVDAVSNLERGISLPSFETLERLAVALGVQVRDFFDADESDASRSPRHVELMATLLVTARTLSDDDLEVAVRQVEALAARGKASIAAGQTGGRRSK